MQLSIITAKSLVSSRGGWRSLLLLLLRRMRACGYRSPLAAPLHPAMQKPPLPPPPRHLADTPLTPAASLLSAHSIHNPAGLWLYTLHRLCCLIFSIARCLYNINNPGPDDGNKVQSVEVRRVRAGFDLHNLLQTQAQPSQTHQITWFGEPDGQPAARRVFP